MVQINDGDSGLDVRTILNDNLALLWPVQTKVTGAGLVITTGTAKTTFRMPFALAGDIEVRASLTTAQASGSTLTIDVNAEGVSILSTKITIDNNEKTSLTAAVQPVVSATSIADNAEITVDVDQCGTGGAEIELLILGSRL